MRFTYILRKALVIQQGWTCMTSSGRGTAGGFGASVTITRIFNSHDSSEP